MRQRLNSWLAAGVLAGLETAAVAQGCKRFLDVSGTFSTIDVPDSEWTFASGINDAGQIVGRFTDSTGYSHGFLYDGGTFTTIDPPGSQDTDARGINNLGQIVGGFSDSTGFH